MAWEGWGAVGALMPGGASESEGGILAKYGIDPSTFFGGPGGAEAQPTVIDAVREAAQFASTWQQTLPPWARNLDFDGWKPGEASEIPNLFVWMGEQDRQRRDVESAPGHDPVIETTTSTTTKAKSLEQAMNQPYVWDEEELADAMEKFKEAGIEVNSFDDVVDVWSGLVDRAAKTYTYSEGAKKVTPWDVLDMYKTEIGGGVDPNGTRTTTHKSITEVSEGQAWSTLRGTVSQMLGRDPSDNELRDFTHRMGQMAASNPSISKTISQYKDGSVESSTTTSKSGFTGDDMALAAYEGAQDDPEYAEYQSATTYFNALQSALGPMGG